MSIRERSQVSGGEPITILRMRLLSLEKVGEIVVGYTLEEVHLQMLLWEWRVGPIPLPKCERISPHLNFRGCVGSSVEQAEWRRTVCQGKKQSELRHQDRKACECEAKSNLQLRQERLWGISSLFYLWTELEPFMQFAGSLLSGFLMSSVFFSTLLLLWRFSSLRPFQWVLPFSPNQCWTWILIFLLKQSS